MISYCINNNYNMTDFHSYSYKDTNDIYNDDKKCNICKVQPMSPDNWSQNRCISDYLKSQDIILKTVIDDISPHESREEEESDALSDEITTCEMKEEKDVIIPEKITKKQVNNGKGEEILDPSGHLIPYMGGVFTEEERNEINKSLKGQKSAEKNPEKYEEKSTVMKIGNRNKKRYDIPDRYKTTDEIIDGMANIRKRIVSLILEEPDRITELWSAENLTADNNCMCKMGGDYDNSLGAYYMCKNCTDIGIMCDREKLVYNPQPIESGKLRGKEISLKWLGRTNEDVVLNMGPRSLFLQMLTKEGVSDCNPRNNDISHNSTRFIELGKLSHMMVISWLLQEKFDKLDINAYTEILAGFACAGSSYVLLVEDGSVKLSDLMKETNVISKIMMKSAKKGDRKADGENKKQLEHILFTEKLVSQIVFLLSVLSYYNYSFGNPTIESFSVKNRKCVYECENMKHESSFTLIINPGSSDSITVKSSDRSKFAHIYKRNMTLESINTLGTPLFDVMDYMINNDSLSNSSSDNDSSNNEELEEVCSVENNDSYEDKWFKFNDEVDILRYVKLRGAGMALFPSSFDFYGMIISIMSRKPYKSHFDNSDILNSIWRSMWIPEDRKIAEGRLKDIKIIENSEDVARFLLGLRLRCNIIEIVKSKLF